MISAHGLLFIVLVVNTTTVYLNLRNHVLFQIGCLSATLFMLIFEESEPALWLGTSGAGLFMSSVFPTSIALAEYYIDLTGNYHYHAKYHIPH